MRRTVHGLMAFLALGVGLIGCGKSEEELKKEQAIAGLGQLTDAGVEAQADLVKRLIALGKPAVAPLAEALPKSSGGKKLAIIHILGQIKDIGALEPLTKELKTGPAEVRRAVVEALGAMALLDGLRPLSDAALDDPEPAVRAAAATSLGQLNDPRVLPVLLGMLRDARPAPREAAIAALGSLGEPALNPLLEARRSAEEAVRTGAESALARLAQKFRADLLSEDVEVRVAAIQALGRIGNPELARSLVPFLMDSEERVRLAAVRALERLRNPATRGALRGVLQQPEETPAVRLAATMALGKMGDEAALQELVENLASTEGAVRAAAARALREAGLVALPALQTALRSDQAAVRAAAARALGSLGHLQVQPGEAEYLAARIDAVVVPALIQALRDPAAYVRAAAALSLGEIRSRKALEPLLEKVKEPDPLVAWCAAWAVEKTGERAIPSLLQTTPRPLSPEEVRLLGRIGGPAAKAMLLGVLQDPQQQEAHPEAAWALGELGGRDSAMALLQALDSPKAATRQAAAEALARLARREKDRTGEDWTPRALQALRSRSVEDESPAVRQAAGQAAVEMDPAGGDLVDQWTALLQDRDPQRRLAAARALGARGDLRAVPALQKALSDPQPPVREAAREALQAITGQPLQTAPAQL